MKEKQRTRDRHTEAETETLWEKERDGKTYKQRHRETDGNAENNKCSRHLRSNHIAPTDMSQCSDQCMDTYKP